MSAPPARTLDDFGPLILRNHPLDLHQQFIFCSGLDLPVEEHHTHTPPGEFVEQERLVRVLTREAIWAVDIDELNASDGGQIAQAFQSGSDKRGSTVPVINEFQDTGFPRSVAGNPFAQCRDLTV